MSARLRVLMVEDEALIAMFGETALEQAGHHVTIVGTAREAMAQITASHFDVAVVDLGLPDVAGFDLITWLRKVVPATAVVVSTGYSNHGEDAVSRHLPAGIRVIEKPWFEQDLVDVVSSVARTPVRQVRLRRHSSVGCPANDLAAFARAVRPLLRVNHCAA